MKKLLIKKLSLVLLSLVIAVFANSDISDAVYRYNPRIKEIIDTHEHFTAGGHMEKYLQAAAGFGIKKTVFVPTGKAPDNEGYKQNMAALLQMQKKYPNQIIAFCTVDDEDPEAPQIFENCLKKGGKGLKLINGHPDFYDAPLNSPIMKQLFEVAAEYDVPVLIHITMYRLPQAGEEFKDILDEFPTVTVQIAHYCSAIYDGVHLEICAAILDRYPNVYIDTTMGGGIERYFKYMREDIKPIKDFIIKYQDRITYGTDMILSRKGLSSTREWLRGRMSCDLSALKESQVICPVIASAVSDPVPGFSLPADVLQKILVENPKKILKFK